MAEKINVGFLHFALSLYIPGFLINLGYGIVAPILPLYAQSFNITYVLVALITTSNAAGRLCFDIPLGAVCDRVGRRPLSILGPLLATVSAVLSGLAQSFYQLLAFRFVMGVGMSMWMIAGMAMIADNVHPSMRGKVTTTYQAANMVGTTAGPTVGGFVAQLSNSYRAPFFFYAASALAAMVAALVLIRESAPAKQQRRVPIRASIRKFAGILNFSILMATFMIFTSHIRFAAWNTLLPLYGGDVLKLNPGEIGLVMSVSTLTQFLALTPAGYIIDRYGRKTALIPSFILAALSFTILPLANDFISTTLVAALLGIAGGLGAASWALATDLSPEELRGSFIGFWHTFGDVGNSIGPIILGSITDSHGFPPAFYLVAGLMFLTAATTQLFVKETLKREKQKN